MKNKLKASPFSAGRGGCNIGYLLKVHLKVTSRELSFAHNVLLIVKIVLKFYTEYGIDTAVFCVTFENDLTTGMLRD